MATTIELKPEQLGKESRELAQGGVPVVLSLSAYDIPRSLTADWDKATSWLHIRFDYLDQESPVNRPVDEELIVQVGKHSGKVLGFLVSPHLKKPKEITIRIVQGVEQELARAQRDNQRLNCQLIRNVVSDNMEHLLEDAAYSR